MFELVITRIIIKQKDDSNEELFIRICDIQNTNSDYFNEYPTNELVKHVHIQ